MRGRNHFGMIGEAEVVVGAKVEDRLAGLEGDPGALGRGQNAFPLVEPGPVDPVEGGAK